MFKTLTIPPAEPTDPGWQIPPDFRYRPQTAETLGQFWLSTCYASNGRRPIYNGSAMVRAAELVLMRVDYKEAMRTLAWMATPYSKYFQYPYTLRAVIVAHQELLKLQESGKFKVYAGWLGPVGMVNLLERKNRK